MNTGGPAFPSGIAVGPSGDVYLTTHYLDATGMTLRDYIAIQSFNLIDNANNLQSVAEFCYSVADAMITERDKERI